MSTARPITPEDLLAASAYFGVLGDDDRPNAANMLSPFGDGIATKNGKLVYFNYQVNPSVGYFSEDDPSNTVHKNAALDGEFVEVTLAGGEKSYVHYGSVYLPKDDDALRKIGMLNGIFAVIFQNVRSQFAQLKDLLAETTILNAKLAKLAKLYQLFSLMQASNFSPDQLYDSVTKIDTGTIAEFDRAGLPRPFLEAKIAFMPSLYYAEVRVKTVNSNEDYSLYCMIALRKDGTYTFVRHERKNLDLSYNGVLAAVRGAVPEMFNSAHDINDYMALCRQSHVLEFDIGKVDEKIIPKTSGLSNAIVNLQLLSPQYDRSAAGITPSIRQSPVDVKNQKTTTFLWRYLPIVKEASMVSAGDNVFGSSDDIRNCADVIRQTSDQLSSRGNNVMSMVSLSVGEMQQNFSTASALVGKVGDVQKKTATQ